MQSSNFIKRIKFYSVLSFLVPLIAINSCFALYKFIGYYDTSPNYDWEKPQHSYDEYLKISNSGNQSFTNCPKFTYKNFYTTKDNQIIKGENSDIINEISRSSPLIVVYCGN